MKEKKLNRQPTYKEIFDRTHKRGGGEGEYVDNKSKYVSVCFPKFLYFLVFSL